jgi:hypothetical protein
VRYLAVFGVIPRNVLRNLNAPRACIPEDTSFAIWGKKVRGTSIVTPKIFM